MTIPETKEFRNMNHPLKKNTEIIFMHLVGMKNTDEISKFNTYSKCLNTRTLANFWSVLYIVYIVLDPYINIYKMFQCLLCYEWCYLSHVVEKALNTLNQVIHIYRMLLGNLWIQL